MNQEESILDKIFVVSARENKTGTIGSFVNPYGFYYDFTINEIIKSRFAVSSTGNLYIVTGLNEVTCIPRGKYINRGSHPALVADAQTCVYAHIIDDEEYIITICTPNDGSRSALINIKQLSHKIDKNIKILNMQDTFNAQNVICGDKKYTITCGNDPAFFKIHNTEMITQSMADECYCGVSES